MMFFILFGGRLFLLLHRKKKKHSTFKLAIYQRNQYSELFNEAIENNYVNLIHWKL